VPEVIEPGVAVGAANSAMPMSPTAPGTSIQTAGRKVASCGGPDGHVATHAATGVRTRPPKKPARSSGHDPAAELLPGVAGSEHQDQPAERASGAGEMEVGAEPEHEHAELRRPVAERVLRPVGERLVERDARELVPRDNAEAPPLARA